MPVSPCTTPTGSGRGGHPDHADQPWESILDEKSGIKVKVKVFSPVFFMLLQNKKGKESCVTHQAIKRFSPQCVFCAPSK